MKRGSGTNLHKKNKTMSKKFDDNVVQPNCDVIVIFPVYCQFVAIWNLDFGRIVCETYFFISSNLLSYRSWKQNWQISNTALTILFWVKIPFLLKNVDSFQKYADIIKIKRALVLKVYFLELPMSVYISTKFQVFSIILTNFRKGGVIITPTQKQTPKNLHHN